MSQIGEEAGWDEDTHTPVHVFRAPGLQLSNNNKLVAFFFNLTFMMLQYNSQLNAFLGIFCVFCLSFFVVFFPDLVKITKELNQLFINLPLKRWKLKQF